MGISHRSRKSPVQISPKPACEIPGCGPPGSITRSHTDRPADLSVLEKPRNIMNKVVFCQSLLYPPSRIPLIASSLVGNPPLPTWESTSSSSITTSDPTHRHRTGSTHRRFQICWSSRRHSVRVRSACVPFCPNLTHSTPSSLVFDREAGKPKSHGFCEFAGTYISPFFLTSIGPSTPRFAGDKES